LCECSEGRKKSCCYWIHEKKTRSTPRERKNSLPVYQTELPFPLISRGKVRDIYEVPEGILLVATDRLSAFDVVFPDPIPHKGEVLNQLSAFWFSRTKHITANHLLSASPGFVSTPENPALHGRCSLCRPAQPLPVECVVRGYLEGSAWNDYSRDGEVSGVRLPPGLNRRDRLPSPIFTPSTKAEAGHDEPISFERVVELIGVRHAEIARHKSLELYRYAYELLQPKGIILSDTKFEFGITEDGELILIDEVLTPDSSRFWIAETYRPGAEAVSMDKQFVRDYVERIGWNKRPPAPALPQDVISGTSRRYIEIYEQITDTKFEGAAS
jgi:phosphoribosylaminoimidazole-succinocarboxamide synthase